MVKARIVNIDILEAKYPYFNCLVNLALRFQLPKNANIYLNTIVMACQVSLGRLGSSS